MQSVSCRFPMVTFNPATQAGTANIHAFLKEAMYGFLLGRIGCYTGTGGAETRLSACLYISPSHAVSTKRSRASDAQNLDCIQLLLYHSGHTYSRGLKDCSLPLSTGADLRPKCRTQPLFRCFLAAQVSRGDVAVDDGDHLGAWPFFYGATSKRKSPDFQPPVALEEPAHHEDEPHDQ